MIAAEPLSVLEEIALALVNDGASHAEAAAICGTSRALLACAVDRARRKTGGAP